MTRSCSILVLLFLVSIASAQVPRKISFQGVLTDTAGNPRPDGTYSFTFRIYNASTGNSPLWTESRSIPLKRGLLSVLLGDTAPIPDSLKFDQPYWLGIQLGSSPELFPRTELTSVGYSFRSVRTDTAQFAKGIAPGTAVREVNGITDDVTLVAGSNISINSIGNTLRISAGGGGGSLRFPMSDTAASDGAVLALTNTGYGGAVSGEAKQGGIAVFGQSPYVGVSGFSSGATGVQGGGPMRGVYGLSDLGAGVEGGHILPTGTSPGVYGWSTSQEASAVGILGELTSASSGAASSAVKGLDKGRGLEGGLAGGSSGVYGTADAITSYSHGVYGLNNSTSGTGVTGDARATSGATYGVLGWNYSTGGRGVEGWADASSGTTYGVYGVSRSDNGTGVYGTANSISGTTYGVYGWSGSATGYGVYSGGRIGASGTKSFRIDHPKDPTGKYLLHYSAESPDVLNMYTGNVVTDAGGFATIILPDYFEEINKDPRYTLTVINEGGTEFVQAMVVQKVRNNQFVIRTSKPAIEVSWEVKAIRNDLWVRAAGAPVQMEKQGNERGKYQHPELYGMPKEMGINYRPEMESPRPQSGQIGTTSRESSASKEGNR